jgi:uncharacterized protein
MRLSSAHNPACVSLARRARKALRAVVVTALALTGAHVAGSGPAAAQPAGYILVDPQRGYVQPRVQRPVDPYGRPIGGGYYQQPAPQPPQGRVYPQGYYPGMLVQPAPQPQPGFNLRRLFGIEEEAQPVAPRPVPHIKPNRPKSPSPAVVARAVKPKLNPSTHVVVFGDALADLTGQGIEDTFADTPDVAVVTKVRGESGLVRNELADWPKTIQDTLNGGQKITVGVVMLGASDRQPIREGDVTYEPLSERWKALYRDRVDAVVRVFHDRNIPLIWIGLPPMKNDKVSADLIVMNEIVRDSVQRAGFTYVDIWPGFVDDDNRYTVVGPDVDGQNTRLRANDGVLFTKAGARKVAHFADAEIKRIIEGKQAGAVAAVPAPSGATSEPQSVDQMINAALPSLPEPAGLPSLPVKPIAGPVLPLTRPDVSPGGTLISGRPRLDGDAAYTLQKTLREGVAPNPRAGRADDFRWPRS